MDWHPMKTAPTDGEPFLAGLWVHQSNAPGSSPYFETHVIAADDEVERTIHRDFDHGWAWDDYTHWHPIVPPSDETNAPAE